MAQLFILDTNVLVDFYRGRLPRACAEAVTGLLREERCVLSLITQAELLSFGGITPEEEQFLQEVCRQAVVLDFHALYLDDVIALRKERRMRLPDAIIAGMARRHKLAVITADVDDFKNRTGVLLVPSHELAAYLAEQA